MRIKGVLFDKDGTLFDFHRTWVPILAEAALVAARGDASLVPGLMAAGGYDEATGRVASGSVIAAGNTPELALLWLQTAPLWEAADLTARLDAFFAEQAPRRSEPVTDLGVLLAALRGSGLRVGIATNDSVASAFATIGHFGLAELVEFHCGYDSGHGTKPEPGMVHAFCDAVGLSPGEVAVVGDNFHDLEMGLAAGAGLRVGVLTGTSAHDDLAPHADFVIGSIVELPALLGGLS
ncbi:MAG: HAD family hydrolase [Parvibaculum sp.]|nr:HAD family hydrolase [Parvibaculum sp.]